MFEDCFLIVLITALQETDDKIKGLEAGADEFLNRPVDTPEIQARVKSLISLKRYREQLHEHMQSKKVFSALSDQLELTKEKRLLIVEDDAVAARLILNFLKEKPYNIELFTEGVDVIKRDERGDVDLILLDIMLPGMDGFEICQHLREISQIQNIQIL